MKTSLIALVLTASLLATGCGGSEPEGGNGLANDGNTAATQAEGDGQARGAVATAVETSRLTGLYESGSGAQKNQLCIVDKGTGNAQFGLIVWGANMHSCAGAGSAVRSGSRLTLTMAGDSSCAIEARMERGRIFLPASVPAGCSYYCGAQARMATTFERTGATVADAMRARDLAGDSLCEGSAG